MITKLLPKPLTAALSVLAFALLLVAPGSVNAFGGAPNDLWVDITIGPWNSRNIGPGQQYAVGWTIHGQISSCTATGDWSWVYPPSSFQNGVWTNIYGTAVFSAPASGAKTFHLSCSGPTGSAQDTETIHVGNYNDLNPEPWLSLVLNQPDNLCPGCIGTGPGQQMRFQWGINNYAGMSLGTCRAWGDITDFQGTGPIMGPYGSGAEEFRTDPPTLPNPFQLRK
jgi:hypothetical protein